MCSMDVFVDPSSPSSFLVTLQTIRYTDIHTHIQEAPFMIKSILRGLFKLPSSASPEQVAMASQFVKDAIKANKVTELAVGVGCFAQKAMCVSGSAWLSEPRPRFHFGAAPNVGDHALR